MDSPPVPVLLVGVGNRGLWPLEHCTEANGWKVVGLVDINPEFLEKARLRTGLPTSACFNALEPALEALKPRAAVFCTPTITHAPFTKAAISRGVAVLCEKGMATCWNEAVDLVRFVARHAGTFAVAQNYRYGPLASLVRASLHGALLDGRPVPATGRAFMVDYVQHRVRPVPRTLTYPFASVWDMSCHHFDNLLDWLGPVRDLTAFAPRAAWSAYEHPGNTSAFLTFENGTVVNYVHTHDASRGSLRVEVHGENGCLLANDDSAAFSARPTENFGACMPEAIPLPPFSSERRMLEDFRTYVLTGREPGISGRRNLETMALCEMTVRSVTLRRTVTRAELDSGGT